ncbi:glucose-1-phosphatase [Erwiniaceae bacterium BAC15a-03b]|uniref:Glucose-1-phosphatase n=1 Tax=Winslowiella arboricola TaxID=2978220 RepID=A0A9J6PRC2_9GAMM|nr:glucose-1-phosphatase [Winslowiella arboricola]MCU5773481.1 glucose-1-phosphatase [Winslowiella arboricola]MCU5776607.1 glucose-1-phosphatase [Winslowiella arboricola]
MLYIFDLGNVIVDIDFNRVLGVWSDLGRVPLATLQSRFRMGDNFEQHERGEISDEHFAANLCEELDIALSYEQFAAGWQAVFIDVRPEVIAVMHQLREQGHRVVILSNTNQLHCSYWPSQYPQVQLAADKLYLSQEMGVRKPEAAIYRQVLAQEEVTADQALFFDDNLANIEAARALGITSVHVTDASVIPAYFAQPR